MRPAVARALAGALVGLAGAACSEDPDVVSTAVLVEAHGCGPQSERGAGSMVADRLAITAAHVVAGTDDVEVAAFDGQVTSAEVVRFDPDLDLAVLRLDQPLGETVDLRDERAAIGETGRIVVPDRADDDHAEVVEVEVLRSVDIRTTDIYLEDEVVRPGFEIEAAIDEGDSGAVVLIDDRAVGMVWARSNRREGRAWAIDMTASTFDDDELAVLAEPSSSPPVDVGACVS